MCSRNRCCACWLLSLALVAGGSACTSTRRGVQRLASSHLADTATSYNLAIEQTQDEMLLLNVIRAQDNYPMYITTASKVTGTVKADISLGLKIPLLHTGSANANDVFAMPSVDYSSSPSMDVNLLNTKDFMTGFLAPITSDQFAYYWDQGWCDEFLLYLLVLKVERFGPSKPPQRVDSYYNQPDVLDLTKFSQWVDELVGKGRPRLCKDNTDDALVGPALDENHLGALKFLVPVAKEGLSLTATPGVSATAQSAGSGGKWQLTRPNHMVRLVRADQDCAGGGTEDVLTLRSPEGVLYYLGQLARMENPREAKEEKRALLVHHYDFNPADKEKSASAPRLEPLFVALDKSKHGQCQSIIWVRSLDGDDYMIPKGNELTPALDEPGAALKLADASRLCATGQSMHALTLLSQLISLQMTAKDFTTTSTVKVVGQ